MPLLAVNFIKKYEGFSPKPYICPAGDYTIGYGHTSGVISNMLMSEPEASSLLAKDLQKLIDPIINACGILLNDYQLSSLLSFSYNCGLHAFLTSTLELKIKQSAPPSDIVFQFNRWNKIHGTVSPGLVARRSAESALYFTT